MELTPMSDFEIFLMDVLPLLAKVATWIVFLTGITVCAWAWRTTKSIGYLILGIYFLQPVIAYALQGFSERLHDEEIIWHQHQIESDGQPTVTFSPPVVFPVFEAILVGGIFITSRRHTRLLKPTMSQQIVGGNE